MRFLVTFACLAVVATAVLANPVEVEIEQDPVAAAVAQETADTLLDVDTETGHENESERQARQFGYGRGGYGGYRGGYGGYGYGGYGGYRGGYGGYGGYRGGYGGYRGGYGGYRGGFYG